MSSVSYVASAVQTARVGVKFPPHGVLLPMPDEREDYLEKEVLRLRQELQDAEATLDFYRRRIAARTGPGTYPDRPAIRQGEYNAVPFPRAAADYLKRKSTGRATIQELIEEVVTRGHAAVKNPRTSLKMLSDKKQGGNPNPVFIWHGHRESDDLSEIHISLANPSVNVTDIGSVRTVKTGTKRQR